MSKVGRVYSVIFILLLLVGCGGPPHLQTRIMAGANLKVCSIALMPLENWTQQKELPQLVGRNFASQLISSKEFSLVQGGDVGMFMLRQRLRPGTPLYREHFAALDDQLKLDAIIQGRIVETGTVNRRGGEKVPFLSLHLDMYDARTGHLLLNTVHRRFGDDYRKVMHFGVITTKSGLAARMAQEIIEDWLDKGIRCR